MFAQIPVELFVGNQRTTIDVLLIKGILDGENTRTPWTFLNRTRASMDHAITETERLPQFGFTQAVSYNHASFGGFAPVVVVLIKNEGVYPKAGIEFVRSTKHFTVFTWLVCRTTTLPDIDYFLIARWYMPALTERLRLFSQVETVNTLPTTTERSYSFTQRFRLGIAWEHLQVGIGTDFQQIGRASWHTTSNIGAFVRYEF